MLFRSFFSFRREASDACLLRKFGIASVFATTLFAGGVALGQGGGGGGGNNNNNNNNNGNFNNNGFNVGNRVGGVKVDANGVLRALSVQEQDEALEEARRSIVGPQGELKTPANQRLVSLKKIQQIVLESQKTQKPLPEEVSYLGGLTRVSNVFVYPERNDIVIAGPAEPWTVGPNGTIVGIKSGRPIVTLDDLLNAMRTVDSARKTGISVSIDPTEEGTVRLRKLLSQVKITANQSNWQSLETAMRDAFGPQQVKLQGVSANTRMARVILTADYKMKLYGMNLEKAPVDGLPSYLDMMVQSKGRNVQSRWWMTCDYSSIEHSADRLAWKITGRGIKTLTEEEQIAADGSVSQKGKADPIAKKWADTFTSKLEELSVKDPVFGELRNIMDLCVVAAIIQSNGLQELAGCDLSACIGDNAQPTLSQVAFPTSLDPQCSFVRAAQGFVVSASGGVMVDSWQVAATAKTSDELSVSLQGKQWSEESRIWQ